MQSDSGAVQQPPTPPPPLYLAKLPLALMNVASPCRCCPLLGLFPTRNAQSNTAQEIKRLEKLIGNQHIPLSFATTRLQTRILRPDPERTIDSVHRSLIKEVAEMDEAVATLQSELNSNLCNLQDLKILESMLEEDYGIKKVTFNLEKRCKKIRSFLRPDADNYIVSIVLPPCTTYRTSSPCCSCHALPLSRSTPVSPHTHPAARCRVRLAWPGLPSMLCMHVRKPCHALQSMVPP